MGNTITVDVRLTKEPEAVSISAKNKVYLPVKGLVSDTVDGPKWYDGVVFGPMAQLVKDRLHKGDEIRVEGELTVKEYTKRDGEVGTSNNLIMKKLTLEGGIVLDKFTPATTETHAVKPPSEDAPF